jgi:hypothetical protein
MKTFYSILYTPIRPIVDEKVSMALLLVGEDHIYFDYSERKLEFAKDLMPKQAYSLLKSNLKNLKTYINDLNSNKIKGDIDKPFINFTYFNYLNKYSNNLLTFSKPKQIEKEINTENFLKLFEKLIFKLDSTSVKLQNLEFIEEVKNKLEPRIKKHVNIDKVVDSSILPNIEIPTKVWFIGKNDEDVTGETIDFNKQSFNLNNYLRSYLYLIDRITQEHKGGKFFLVGDEPSKELKENHSIWEGIIKLNNIDYIPLNELQKIEEYLESHHVKPIVSIEAE